MNGDILCNLDYRDFFNYHIQADNDVTVSTFKRQSKIDFGVLQYHQDNQIHSFIEKPTYHFDVSMGIYSLNRRVIEKLIKAEPYGFDDLMLDGIKNKSKILVRPFNGYWLDIGRPEDYENANENYNQIKIQLGL
jgi:NDP-sugar pyrophosphorylase family protein